MKGYIAKKGERYYAVIYEGIDPITGRERRRWYPAGSGEQEARDLAGRLASARAADRPGRSSLTVAVYLTQRWLPSKQLSLRASTWDGYRRNIELHVVPHIGRVPLRHLRPDHLERLYAELPRRAAPTAPEAWTTRPSSRSTPSCAAPSTTPCVAAWFAPTRRRWPTRPSGDRLPAPLPVHGTPSNSGRFSTASPRAASRRAVAGSEHRHASRRAPRPSLGRGRPRGRTTLGGPITHLGRLPAARDAWQDPDRSPIDRSRRPHRRHPQSMATTASGRGPRLRSQRRRRLRFRPTERLPHPSPSAFRHVQ